jgi:hypothetical protein
VFLTPRTPKAMFPRLTSKPFKTSFIMRWDLNVGPICDPDIRNSRPRWFTSHPSMIKLFRYILDCLLLPLTHWFFVLCTSMAMRTSEFLPQRIFPLYWERPSSSDFLTNLLVLLLRVLNCGLSDSGLLAHLSEATAGSLNGIGHSTAYEELSSFS